MASHSNLSNEDVGPVSDARRDEPDVAQDARVSRTLALASRLVQAIIADPAMLRDIPDGATVYLIPDGDPDYAEMALAAADRAQRAGHRLYVHRMSHPGP